MTGAINFLRKAKAICKSRPSGENSCVDCPIGGYCVPEDIENEADLVSKVMAYEIKENQPQEDTNE